MYDGDEYWKNYMVSWFGADLIDKWERYCAEEFIRSNDNDLHLEIYDTGQQRRPTLIFSHGIAGYARVLLPFIIPLREKGYNIIAPDLQGYGYSRSRKGDFEWNIHLRNLADTVAYAKDRFSGLSSERTWLISMVRIRINTSLERITVQTERADWSL